MLASEKNILEQDENSTSSNNENEFKELDNEIEKVIRGETSFEEDKNQIENNIFNDTSNISKNNPNIINNIIDKNIINVDVNNNNENESNNFISINSNKKTFQNKSDNFIKSVNNNIINFDEKFFKKIKNNYSKNNNSKCVLNNVEDNNQHQDFKSNSNKNKNNINNINHNFNINNYINYNTNEFISLNNKNLKKNKNKQNKNKIKLNNDKIHSCIINNLSSFNHININNNPLFASIYNYYSSQLQQKYLFNNNYNNIIINNQMINPININIQIENNYIDVNSDCKYINHLYNNGFNEIINKNLGHYLQMNNNGLNLGAYNTNNNMNINNQFKQKDEIFINQLNNNPKLMDLIINNNIINNINNKYLNFINSNQIINNNNFNKNIKNYNQEKSGNIQNRKKIFNPLPDSEKEKNIINLMDIIQCKDLRTTIMIKNIPNKYSISLFLEEINDNFKNTYDIFYLPIDYINKCNLGFAFINFVEPFHIILFYELYRGKKWKKYNSDKVCELLYAKYQGRKELISHFEKGKVLSFESEEKRPLILPLPNPLPKINLPCYYLDLFLKLYPFVSYKIKKNNNKNDNSLSKLFSINGNFYKN